jgi:hypothetical protein
MLIAFCICNHYVLNFDTYSSKLTLTLLRYNLVFGTDPDRNRVTWETPSSEAIPFRRKPLRRARLLRDPAQTQV